MRAITFWLKRYLLGTQESRSVRQQRARAWPHFLHPSVGGTHVKALRQTSWQ